MKTFTATELNKSPLKIFRAVDQTGAVKINHDRYPDKLFILESRDRRCLTVEDKDALTEICEGHDSQRLRNFRNAYISECSAMGVVPLFDSEGIPHLKQAAT